MKFVKSPNKTVKPGGKTITGRLGKAIKPSRGDFSNSKAYQKAVSRYNKTIKRSNSRILRSEKAMARINQQGVQGVIREVGNALPKLVTSSGISSGGFGAGANIAGTISQNISGGVPSVSSGTSSGQGSTGSTGTDGPGFSKYSKNTRDDD